MRENYVVKLSLRCYAQTARRIYLSNLLSAAPKPLSRSLINKGGRNTQGEAQRRVGVPQDDHLVDQGAIPSRPCIRRSLQIVLEL